MKAIVQADDRDVHETHDPVDLPPAAEQASPQGGAPFTETLATPDELYRPRLPRDSREMLAEPIPARDFVVGGLLARRDQALLVAADLWAVTLLGWQMAVQVAAGVHPVTLERVRPVRVLLVDHLSPEDTMKRTLEHLVAAAGQGARRATGSR